MKTDLQWLNEVGETVATDMLSASGPPGEQTRKLIAAIQADAQSHLKPFEDFVHHVAHERKSGDEWTAMARQLLNLDHQGRPKP